MVTIINVAYGIRTNNAELKNMCAIFTCSIHLATQATDSQLSIIAVYRVYYMFHLKYGIYKPREVVNPIKKRVRLRTSFFI